MSTGLLASSAPSACIVHVQSIATLWMSVVLGEVVHVSRICITQLYLPVHISTYDQRH
jgi:hypothetical protein